MIEDLIKERLNKLETLKKAGYNPYPAENARSHFVSQIKLGQKKITVVGRVRGLRVQGGVIFIDIVDATGKIQAVALKDNLKDFEILKNNLDIGDFLQVGGNTFKTKKGELSVEVKNWKFLVKSLRPLPDQWSGFEDIEKRLRQRYLDLLFNPKIKEVFIKKEKFWQTIRNYLKKEEFLEVEVPVLETIPGGADAEPFVTHHHALDTDFYLRISLELPLKKLLVGGFEKVFEIGRVFRNEGIDKEHLQDYTQLEFYWAYADYNDLMQFIEKMYKEIVKKTTGSLVTPWNDQKINWGKKWPKLDYYELFKKYVNLDLNKANRNDLYQKALSNDLRPEEKLGRGRLIDLLYKKLVRPHLIQPAFLINPPVDIEPLAKRLENYPNRVARIQVVACATELGKGFSEANDPIDQRKRFEEQMKLREAGDREAQRLDEDFLQALEYGMPPAAGFGLSERLFAVLMNKPVRETVIFPLMRPR